MAYEIVMPQLSDSMEEGTLVSWKVKVGDSVNQGDVIAEVESDKAIMEVQSFKEGKVESLTLSEGESATVGTVITRIEVGEVSDGQTKKKDEPVKKPVIQQKKSEAAPVKKEVSSVKEDSPVTTEEVAVREKMVSGTASPKAKALAGKHGIDIEKLQAEGKLPKPSHTVDIKKYYEGRYFTPKALRLLSEYDLSTDLFEKGKKQSEADIKQYIAQNNIPLPEKLSSMQKNIIATVTVSAQKPVYHIYDSIDNRLLDTYADDKYTVTLWLIKLFSEAMMQHESFRTTLGSNGMQVWPNASLSVAMASDRALYMPVFNACNTKSIETISEMLKDFKKSVKEGRISPEAMRGSTFGISNLGMTGIERFDAMINGNDCGIAAIGAEKEGKIAVTLTLDHRIVNGWEGAAFMQTLKTLADDPLFFKESE